MAADGTVNIDVILNGEQVQQKARDIDTTLKSLGEDAGNKAEKSIEDNANKSTEKVKNAHEKMKQETSEPVTQKVKSDTDEATKKINEYKKQTVEIPKSVKTKLIAEAKEQGIDNFDKLLHKIPKKQLTELIAKAQKGEAINYEELLHKIPSRIVTEAKLNNRASGELIQVKHQADETASSFSHLKEIVAGSFLGGLASRGIGMITSSLGGLIQETMSASDAIYKFKSTMKLGGFGEEEIARSTKEMKKYADETVYDLGDVSNTTAQLAANGIKNYMELTEAAGNLNAQAGGTAETFKSVAMVMTQTAGAGKLTTENWNQLTDAIPGASGVLQKAMKENGAYTGNFRDAMANGQITAEEFNKAVTQLGMNKGAVEAAKSTETFEGAFGNLQANVISGLNDMVNAIGKKRMTDAINAASNAVVGLTGFVLKMFTVMSEHKQIAIALGSVLAGAFATKRILEFISVLGQAKKAMMEFGIASQLADKFKLPQVGSSGLPSTGVIPNATEQNAGIMSLLRLNTARGALGTLRANKTIPILSAAAGVGTELLSNNNTGQKVGGSVGSIAGTALGAFAGSFMGPTGTMVGSMAGEWLGKKIGEAAGNAANKALKGHSIVAHTKIKVDADTEGTSKAIRPDLNKITRTVIKMSVDPKSIADTKQKTDKLYSDMSQSLKKYYSDKEARSKKNLEQLVKEGVITQQQANKKLQAEKRADDARIKQEQKTISTMQKDTNNHYKKLENIESGGTKKLESIAKKYGTDSKKYNQERIREIQKENQRYIKTLVSDQMKADRSVQASIKKGATQQEKIYKDLIKRKGKLSQQDLKQTQRDANKQYQATVRPAQKARDEVIKAANSKYKSTVKAAEHEYKETHTISKRQYEEIVDNAKAQRDGTVKEADRQYKEVTKKASDQHKKVSREIEDQKNDVNKSAMDEATGHISASQTEMQGVNSNYSSGYSHAGGIWNKFLNGVRSVLKFFQQNTKNMPSVPTGYATGTGALKENQLALVGEEGFELAHTPRGYEVLGADGPEVRYLSAGTSILTHAQSTAAMAMNGGKLPGYAKGTGAKIEDFIDSAKDGMEEVFDLIGKGASEIWDWIKQKTGLDKMLGSQPSMGGVKRTTKGSFDYAKNAISSYIKKMADKFMDSIGGGGKMSKEAFAKAAQVAAALMHQSLSASDIERLYWQAMVESTVNPAQGGGIDDHDGTGRPIGLFQFKLGTWGAAVRHLPAGHSNIHSAVDQIMAVLADSTWRSDLAPIGVRRGWSPQSYANGGWAHKLSIFGEVPGEPELAVNPARDSSEDHIAEAIEARAKINPNGFAGTLSKLIESVKNSANSLVPVINQGTSQVRTAGSVANRQVKIDGNMNVVMNVDGKTIGHVTYATWRAIRSHELNIQANGGAIPVGGARPLGGVY